MVRPQNGGVVAWARGTEQDAQLVLAADNVSVSALPSVSGVAVRNWLMPSRPATARIVPCVNEPKAGPVIHPGPGFARWAREHRRKKALLGAVWSTYP